MTAVSFRLRHRALARAALLGVLLRIAVPAGFMPAEISGGWYLQLCPDGLSATVVAALLGHAHHAHHEHDTADSGYLQCELGGGLCGAMLPEPPAQPVPAADVARFAPASAPTPGPRTALRSYDSRGPPLPFLPS